MFVNGSHPILEASERTTYGDVTKSPIGFLFKWVLLKLCHAVKSLYHVSRHIVAICLSMLCSNALIAFDNDRLWLFQSVLTTHNTLRRVDPTKYRAWTWNCEYSVWLSTWKHGWDIPMIFCSWDYRNELIFSPQSLCDAEIPPVFALQAAVHKQTNAVQYLSASNRTAQFPCFIIIPMLFRRFEMACCVTPNDPANSCCIWHESWSK